MTAIDLKNFYVDAHVFKEWKKKSEDELWLVSLIPCKFLIFHSRIYFNLLTNTGTGPEDSANIWKEKGLAE